MPSRIYGTNKNRMEGIVKVKKLSETGIWFFSIMLFIGLLLGAADCESLVLFIILKAVSVAFILVSGKLLINSIDK